MMSNERSYSSAETLPLKYTMFFRLPGMTGESICSHWTRSLG